MGQHIGSKLNAQISEEAAQWFVDFRCGDVDVEGRRAFEQWVRSSPEHLRAYLEHAAIWNEGDAVDPAREIDVEALIIARASAERNVVSLAPSEKEESRRLRRGSQGAWKFAAAAALAIVLVGSAMTYWVTHEAQAYVTGTDEQRSIRLSDGSTVELNSSSRVRVIFGDQTRRLELLEGQALFKVAKDVARPFIVRIGNAEVRAVGTQFDINRRRTGMVVTVLEGKVAVSHDIEPEVLVQREAASVAAVYVSAGEAVTIREHVVPAAPHPVNVAVATAWMQRQLVLESASLAQVAEEFSRYSSRKLIAEDTSEEPLRLSGVFETSPDFLLRYLRARPDITVTESDSEIQIIHRDRK